jgi:hydrogenase maturation protein HypF
MFRALAGDLADGTPPALISARFHEGLAEAFAAPARRLVETGAARAVALSGGCLQNARLLGALARRLTAVPLLLHARVPANDGGLALGQAAIAAAESL